MPEDKRELCGFGEVGLCGIKDQVNQQIKEQLAIQPENNYGTILADILKPFQYFTQKYQYRHPNECMQWTTNLNQTNVFNEDLPSGTLTNVESALFGLDRKLSRLPEDKQIRVVSNIDANYHQCPSKIITQKFLD